VRNLGTSRAGSSYPHPGAAIDHGAKIETAQPPAGVRS
jgi:hypothetical protein